MYPPTLCCYGTMSVGPSRSYRSGRGELTFTVETSGNCFVPTISDLRAAFKLLILHHLSLATGFSH